MTHNLLFIRNRDGSRFIQWIGRHPWSLRLW